VVVRSRLIFPNEQTISAIAREITENFVSPGPQWTRYRRNVIAKIARIIKRHLREAQRGK